MGTLYGGHAAKEDDITQKRKEKATVIAYILYFQGKYSENILRSLCIC